MGMAGFADSVNEAARRINQSMKESDDEKEGWVFEEVKPVQVRFGNYTSAIIKAEVHREPQMGFRRPERTTVKVGIPLVSFGQAGFRRGSKVTLLENGQPVGQENGWTVVREGYRVLHGFVIFYLDD